MIKTIKPMALKLRFAVVLFLLSQAVHAQKEFVVLGSLQAANSGYIYIRYKDGTKVVNDSVRVDKGKFTLKGALSYPTLITLTYSPADDTVPVSYEMRQTRNYRIFLEGGERINLEARDSLSGAVAKGSPLQDEYVAYSKKIGAFYDRLRPVNLGIYRLEREGKRDSVEIYKARLKHLNKEEEQLLDKIIKERPGSPVSLLAVYDFERPSAMVNKPTRPFFEKLSPEVRRLPMGVMLEKILSEKEAVSVGKKAHAFQLPDTLGRMVDFAGLKDKYVLLDFWASWCGPCRLQHPFLREVYQQFHKSGFNIVSVSLDNSHNKWMAAIRADEVGKWIHVSDLKGIKGEVPVKYFINSVPHNFLIDMRTKTIVGTDLFGFELDKKLNALMPASRG